MAGSLSGEFSRNLAESQLIFIYFILFYFFSKEFGEGFSEHFGRVVAQIALNLVVNLAGLQLNRWMEHKTESQLNRIENGVAAEQMNGTKNGVAAKQNGRRSHSWTERNRKITIFYGVVAFWTKKLSKSFYPKRRTEFDWNFSGRFKLV